MKVVIVDGDVSYPATSGKRLRTLNLMLQLSHKHEITYVARSEGDAAQDQEAAAFLRQRGVLPVLVPDPLPRKRGLSFYARLAANLFSPLPYSVASHHSDKLRAAVAELVARQTIDLFQLEWSGYLYAVPPQMPIVLQAHNIDSLIWQRYHEAETHPLRRWYIARQWQKFLRFEREAFRAVRDIVTVSVEDATLARQWFGVDHFEVVDNGVDVHYFADVRPEAGSRAILYLGALDWRPNLDALELLLDAIFPSVRALVPEARLLVVGRSPPERLRRRIAAQDGVELHANVPDVRPFLARSAVMAVPLRIGGGSRLKVLESLAAGLPVVSTRVGAEGLALRPGQDFTQVNTPEEMTRELVRVLNHPEQARQQAIHGRETVAGRYDWSTLAVRLERVWEKARRRGGTDR
ncbi:MAG: glycosyltransferase family 4 protein [Gemmataceae bacterium]